MKLSGKKLTTAILAGLMGATMFGSSVFADTTLDAVQTLASQNSDKITDLTSRVSKLETASSDATQNTKDIAANKTAIDKNTADITTNKDNIAANKTAIDKNAADIATNKDNIAANKTAIDKNTADITTNKDNIAANKTAIDKNTADIATNKDNIAANKTAIDKNAADIAINKTSIANVSGQVDALQKDSATVKDAATLINKNADAINNIGQYENRLSKAEKDLKTVTQISNNNAAAIGSDTNGTAVKEGKFVHALSQNTEDPLKSVTIGTNLNALDDAVDKANQQINTNKTDIATNKKAINDEAATRQAADQNLQNQINNNSTSINDLYGRYSSLKTDINKVGARSAALAGLHPLDFDPANKLNFAVASGSFKGENSVALGAFYRPNENIMFSAASTMGDSDNAYTFGLSFKIGPSSAKTKTTSPDAEELYKVVGELQDQLAAQQKEIEQLKADKAK